MTKTQYVTITLDEYKELLLREKPSDDDKKLLEYLFNILTAHLKYNDERWGKHPMKDVESFDEVEAFMEIFEMLKYIDFDRYMNIWNTIQTNERKRKEEEMKIEQMNKAKEIRNSKKEEENESNSDM